MKAEPLKWSSAIGMAVRTSPWGSVLIRSWPCVDRLSEPHVLANRLGHLYRACMAPRRRGRASHGHDLAAELRERLYPDLVLRQRRRHGVTDHPKFPPWDHLKIPPS